jgi:PST family polysaccharide transporter
MAIFVLLLRHELAGKHLNVVLELGITAACGAAVYIGALFILGIRRKAISMQAA